MRWLPPVLSVLLTLICAISAADPIPAKAPAPPPIRQTRGAGDAPAIELADAVAKSRHYARSHGIDLSKQYLQSASFDSVKRRWSVVWQMPNAKGGRTEFTVPESGTIGVLYGE